jgi:hypothetical protein
MLTLVYQLLRSKITANIIISVSKSPTSNTSADCDIRSDQLVASDITFRLQIQYGVSSGDVSSGDVREYIYTLESKVVQFQEITLPFKMELILK